jgi:Zn-dependent hydrolases, including glyoxylases
MKISSLQVGPIGTNCYLLQDEREALCAIIDPGGEASRIRDAVARSRCAPVCVLLTHGHFDHTGGVADVQAAYPGIPVYRSPKEVYPDGGAEARRLFPSLSGDIRSYGEGDTVRVGGLSVSVLDTPGHSEGGVTLLCGDAMFPGDTLFAGSCGRTDFLGGSPEKMLASLRRLGQLSGNYRVYPGHMEPTDLDAERRENPWMLQALRG